MQWGGSESFFKVVREDTGTPHPADIGRPALRNDCIKYFDAFRYLGASRLWSEVGPQPVQVSEVKAYVDMIGLDDVDTKLKFLKFVQLMDRVELASIQRKMNRGK